MFLQELNALAGDSGDLIGGGDLDVGYAGGEDGLGAGRRLAVVAAGFKSYEEGCAGGRLTVTGGVGDGLDFGVGAAVAMVPAPADNTTVVNEQGAHAGVGRGPAFAAGG